MQPSLVELVGRNLLQAIKVPRGGVRVMTFTTTSGEKVLRVLVLPKYSSVVKEIPEVYEGVRVLTEVQDYSNYTLH